MIIPKLKGATTQSISTSWNGLWNTLRGATGRTTLLALVDQAVVSGTNFVTLVLIGRWCAKQDLGVYELLASIAIFVVSTQQSLVTTPYTIYGSRLEGTARIEYAGSILVHYLLFSFLAVAVLALTGVFLSNREHSSELTSLIWLLSGIVPFLLLRDFSRRFEFAHLRFNTILGLDTVVGLVQITIFLGLAVSGRLSVGTSYMAIGSIAAVAGLFWLFRTRNEIAVRLKQGFSELGRSWNMGKWLCAGRMVSTINSYSLHWLLAFLIDTAATGTFTACYTVILFANPVLLGVANVIFPQTANAYAQGGLMQLRRFFRKATLLILSGLIIFCVAVFCFNQWMMLILFGNKYLGFGHTINVLALALFVGGLKLPVVAAVTVLEKTEVIFRASLSTFVVTLISAFLLVPQWHVRGAAYSVLIGSITGLGVIWILFWRVARQSHQAERTDIIP